MPNHPLLVHLSVRPFVAACGADVAGQATTEIAEHVTCEVCHSMRDDARAAIAHVTTYARALVRALEKSDVHAAKILINQITIVSEYMGKVVSRLMNDSPITVPICPLCKDAVAACTCPIWGVWNSRLRAWCSLTPVSEVTAWRGSYQRALAVHSFMVRVHPDHSYELQPYAVSGPDGRIAGRDVGL